MTYTSSACIYAHMQAEEVYMLLKAWIIVSRFVCVRRIYKEKENNLALCLDFVTRGQSVLAEKLRLFLFQTVKKLTAPPDSILGIVHALEGYEGEGRRARWRLEIDIPALVGDRSKKSDRANMRAYCVEYIWSSSSRKRCRN